MPRAVHHPYPRPTHALITPTRSTDAAARPNAQPHGNRLINIHPIPRSKIIAGFGANEPINKVSNLSRATHPDDRRLEVRTCSAAMARVATIVLAMFAAAALLVKPAAAELTRVEHPPKTEGSLNILAVGDWGRRGQYNQTLVAEQVIKLSFRFHCR